MCRENIRWRAPTGRTDTCSFSSCSMAADPVRTDTCSISPHEMLPAATGRTTIITRGGEQNAAEGRRPVPLAHRAPLPWSASRREGDLELLRGGYRPRPPPCACSSGMLSRSAHRIVLPTQSGVWVGRAGDCEAGIADSAADRRAGARCGQPTRNAPSRFFSRNEAATNLWRGSSPDRSLRQIPRLAAGSKSAPERLDKVR